MAAVDKVNYLTPYQFARLIEERSLNAWPALRQILYDGWVLRFANGYSRRNNSVNPMFTGTLPIGEKVGYCEAVFSDWQLPLNFRMTPFVFPPDLDLWLDNAGYEKVSPTSVQTVGLSAVAEPDRLPGVDVEWWSTSNDVWITAYTQMNAVLPTWHQTLQDILTHIPTRICLMMLRYQGQPAACGLVVVEQPFAGLFDIATAADYRRQGLGIALVQHLLAQARTMGAETAYLQVMADNVPALRLYQILGFREIYQYWYRVKPAATA